MKTGKNAAMLAMILASLSLLALSCSLETNSITTTRKALLIGITDYPGTGNDLNYPAADAEAMQTLLYDQGWDTKILTDSQATKADIETAVHDFLGSVPANGTTLIYYSGHGTVNNLEAALYQDHYGTLSTYTGDVGDSLLVPYDFDYRKEIWAGGISPDDLYSWIEEYIATDNVIVIADSCFSGGFVASSDSDDAIAVEFAADPWNTSSVLSLAAMDNFAELLSKNARESENLSPIMISAAGSEEPSYEDYATTDPRYLGYRNGIFTYYLLKSIAGGDSNGDGFVTCTEAYTYSARALDKHWNRQFPSVAFYPHISGGLRDLVLFEAE